MDVKEKLVELLQNAKAAMKSENLSCDIARNMFVVDFMMANGVTVQEWISVEDRLPEDGEYVVCIAKRNPFSRFMPMVARIEKNGWANPITEQYISEVTHWIPMPQPPKGGMQ